MKDHVSTKTFRRITTTQNKVKKKTHPLHRARSQRTAKLPSTAPGACCPVGVLPPLPTMLPPLPTKHHCFTNASYSESPDEEVLGLSGLKEPKEPKLGEWGEEGERGELGEWAEEGECEVGLNGAVAPGDCDVESVSTFGGAGVLGVPALPAPIPIPIPMPVPASGKYPVYARGYAACLAHPPSKSWSSSSV